MAIDELVFEIREICQDVFNELDLKEEHHQGVLVLPDVPGEPFPDTWLMQNARLRDEGRVGGKDLCRRGGLTQYCGPGGGGTRSVCMLRSTLERGP